VSIYYKIAIMVINDVRIGQIVTVSIDSETFYKVVKISNFKVNLIKICNETPLNEISCVELTLVVNS
jgi:hypothetical protein